MAGAACWRVGLVLRESDRDAWACAILGDRGFDARASGLIGFVGLIVPHVLRLTIGPDHRVLVPAAALLGAAFTVVADTLARTLLAPTELPVGALTALVGGPLFLWLLRRELARSAP